MDVALILETPAGEFPTTRDLKVIVMNLGSRAAYDVEVVVNIVRPENSSLFQFPPDVTIGTASVENDGYSFRWTIPKLLGLQRVEVIDGVTHRRSAAPAFDAREDPHEFFGEVTTASFESDHRKGNNRDQVWSVLTNLNDGATEPAQPDYSVEVSVDERFPSPGDIVNFTVTTSHGTDFSVIDQKVAIELTDGLAVDEDANANPPREISYTPDGRAASVSYSNGVFNIGTLKFSKIYRNHSVTLPIRVANNAVVNEQCLTATITGSPPPEAGPYDDDRSDNVAKLCLGPPVLPYFTSDDVQEFVSHPCVGNSDPPCDSANDVRVRAVYTAIDPPAALGPETPLIHIPDNSETRKYDDDTDSVNAGDIVSWQVPVQVSYRPYTDEHERWTNVSDSFSYEMISKDSGFDKLHIFVSWANAKLSDGQRQAVFLATYDPGATAASNGPFNLTAEFEKLGTYEVQYSITATHDNNTDTDTTDDVEYPATGSYIFHVGPMADLAVEDGGANPHVAADQHSLTIIAINNEDKPSTNVQVTGLPAGAEVLYKFPDSSTYDSTTGEWDVGELKVRDYYGSAGTSEPTLVLSASAGDTASVSIANSENYEVCVGPKDNAGDLAHTTQATCAAVTNASWNSTPVYDYNSGDNTATITARAGTGGVHPDAPTLQAPAVHAPAVGIAWSEVEFLHGVPVKDYQVQWSTNGVSGWTRLETELTLPELFDIGIQAGQIRYYRVRAVSEAGVTGPWSAPMSAMPIDTNVPGITISETDLTIREGESAQYTVALHARPHANVSVRINGGGVVSPSPGTLTFNTNDFNMPKTVELTGIQDNDPDNEQVNVTHTISSSDAGYRSLTPDPVAVTVLDDDSGVSVTADQASVNEGEDITFTLTRTGNTDSAITVDLSVSQRGSFLPANQLGARSVNIGANVDAETVTVETENDTVLENAGSVTLVVNSGTGYLLGTPRSATVSVQDDDGTPGQPGTLRAVEGDQQVTLLWDAAPVGDAPVLDYSYRMRRSDRSNWDPDWTTLSGGSTRRSHTVTGLTNGQEYIFPGAGAQCHRRRRGGRGQGEHQDNSGPPGSHGNGTPPVAGGDVGRP